MPARKGDPMSGFFRTLRRFRQQSKIYFSRLQPSIISDNLTVLRRVFAAFALFLVCYGAVMLPMMRSAALTAYYAVFLLLDLPLLLLVRRYGQTRSASLGVVQGLCHLAVWMLLGFVILISVFPFPSRPGIFFPLGYMLMTVLFALPYWQISLSLTLATGLYLVLTLSFKSLNALVYDVTGAITAWLLGFFFLFCVADLRFQNGMTRLELERIGNTDQLTGLLNRRILEQEGTARFRRCQLTGLPAAVLMIDVDEFKAYNDAFGHPAGDECLRQIAAILNARADGLGAMAIRFGGEEFLLFLSSCTAQEAAQLADILLEQVRALALPAPGGGMVTLSIGGAVMIPEEGDALDTLIDRADEALYRAKRMGRNRAVFWTPEDRGSNTIGGTDP